MRAHRLLVKQLGFASVHWCSRSIIHVWKKEERKNERERLLYIRMTHEAGVVSMSWYDVYWAGEMYSELVKEYSSMSLVKYTY